MINQKIQLVIKNITKLSQNIDSINGTISHYLLNLIETNSPVPEMKIFAEKLHISQATLSRYIKKIGLKNFKELSFIIENISFSDPEATSGVALNSDIKNIVKYIKKAKKIYFMGVSDCYFLLEDFNLKLQRMGINTVLSQYQKNQTSLARLATKNDVIFLISFSGKHKDYINAIKTNKSKKILITQNHNNSEISKYANIVLPIKMNNNTPDLRMVTKKERIITLEYIDRIVEELLKNKKLKENNAKCIN